MIISFKNVSFTYPNLKIPALNKINFDIEEGSIVLIAGVNGSGKSTLLKQMRSCLIPNGKKTGQVYYRDWLLEDVDEVIQAKNIAYLNQNVDDQLVHDVVGNELAFNLEAQGIDEETMRVKVGEVASFFNLEPLLDRKVESLSGGEKQCLNLAALMISQPEILLLDEPCSQLDPIASERFIQMLVKIHESFSTTIIIVEQRFESIMNFIDDIILMENGSIIYQGNKGEVLKKWLKDQQRAGLLNEALSLYAYLDLEMKDGFDKISQIKKSLSNYANTHTYDDIKRKRACSKHVLVSIDELYYRFDDSKHDLFNALTMQLYQGDIYALIGSNGSGKSTLCSLIAKGKHSHIINQAKRCYYVPQNIYLLFTKDTIREEIGDSEQIITWCKYFEVDKLLDHHPYDCSLGELHKLAIIKMMMVDADLYLLDEISKGLDNISKKKLIAVLKKMQKKGKTILLISHDLELISNCANRCAFLFHGRIEAQKESYAFFKDNQFFISPIKKVSKNIFTHTITLNDILENFNYPVSETAIELNDLSQTMLKMSKKQSFPIIKLVSFMIIFLLLPYLVIQQFSINIIKIGFIIAFAYVLYHLISYPWIIKDLWQLLLFIIIIPLTLYLGITYFSNHYVWISLLILLEAFIPFILLLEKKQVRIRDIVLLASLSAIGISSRLVLFMFPQMKPIAAISILCGIGFGKESGFLVGAISMLGSNLLLGQGPWTPYQMVAMGLVGYFADIFLDSKDSKLKKGIYTFIMVLFVYGGLMNFSSLILSNQHISLATILSFEAVGLPFDLLHALTSVLFIIYIGDEVLAKFKRYKIKYGFMLK